jgi:hypothetical protein
MRVVAGQAPEPQATPLVSAVLAVAAQGHRGQPQRRQAPTGWVVVVVAAKSAAALLAGPVS